MPTVNDFIQRFSGQGTMTEEDASHYVDRFSSNHEQDREFDNDEFHHGATEYLGQLPDDQFHEAARGAFNQMPSTQRSGLLGGLMGALQGKGLQPSSLAGSLGL